jgi:multidrug efflux pump subunit AcrA (membrane-fusion protein)
LVPVSAIQKTSTGKYEVFVIQNGKSIKQSVEIGLRGSAYVEITYGLDAGAIVETK